MVGPFFYINSKTLKYNDFLYHKVNEENAEKNGNFINAAKGHSELFDEKFKNIYIEYFDFPRGRVIFDIANNTHIIYIDECIKDKADIVAQLYEIKNYVLKNDEHYVCKKCQKTIYLKP